MSHILNPPGQLYDVGGYRLHLHSYGVQSGTPVVFDAGVGGSSLVWGRVACEVATFAPVVVYDRAGYGLSDPAPKGAPLDSDYAVKDLHTLLHAAGVKPPYILIGHSFGGFNVRLYAHRYPEEVAGMVLVDADHEDEWTPRFPEAHRKGLRLATRTLGAMAKLAHWHVLLLLARLGLVALDAVKKLPPDLRETATRLMLQPKALEATHREFSALEQSAAQVRGMGALGDLPLVVLRRGLPGPTAPGVSKERATRLAHLAAETQSDLAHLSTRGELEVAERSGHDIMLDEPERVVGAIRSVVESLVEKHHAPLIN